MLDFIWKETNCNCIKISLHHFATEEGGKLSVYADLKKLLKGLGFKWKQLTNTHGGKRIEFLEA